jgi:hypothetical protein
LSHIPPNKAAPGAKPAGARKNSAYGLMMEITKENVMLYTIAVLLILLWAVGLLSAYTMGGLIHALLVIAVVVILLRLISGRTPV